jgi:hypothetical protein
MSINPGVFLLAWAVLENATMPIANAVPAHAIRRNLTALSI